MSNYHQAVLIEEISRLLEPKPGKLYIDATLGGGNHTKALIDQGAKVIGLDQDPDAVEYVAARTDIDQSKLRIITGNFEHLSEFMNQAGVSKVDGILFDLGVSSHQFDTPQRGFSFQADAPLDMRMSPELAVTAKDLINGLGKRELYDLFTKYAGEQLARPISEAIVRARSLKPISTTRELATLVEKVYRHKRGHLHPATKVFQALRIAINDEINVLKNVLPQAVQLLNQKGKIAVISFHEGEDRIVKHFMKELNPSEWQLSTPKPITPTEVEIHQNPRSRSAKLRIIQKI